MRERIFTAGSFFLPGTLTGNHVMYVEHPFAWTLLGVQAGSVNDSDATLAVGGGATITAAAIGDGAMSYLTPSAPDPVGEDPHDTQALDYDGASGTAAQGVSIQVVGLNDEGGI